MKNDDIVEKIIVDILVSEMELSTNNVFIEDQNVVIPDEDGLFITVAVVDVKPIGSANYSLPTAEGMEEHQEVLQRENVQIDLVSRDNSARNRRAEVLMALASFFSKQKQEEQEFKIFTIPTTTRWPLGRMGRFTS